MYKVQLQKAFLAQSIFVQLGFALLFNTLIAVLLTLVMKGSLFGETLLVSQCIGLTIFFTYFFLHHFIELKGWRTILPLVVAAVPGVLLGITAVGLTQGATLSAISEVISNDLEMVLVNLFLAFFFGGIMLYFYLSRESHYHASSALKEVQIKNLDHEKQIAETQLRLLQAQIEPHFLFNSLSNVISLIEHDAPRAKLMLESLTRYLRSSLSRSHEQDGKLKDELDLIENYLKIIQIRMGERLSYKIDVAEPLRQHAFPIMLLQPLVENAIHHGLEPMAEGGQIIIEARQNGDDLQIRVIDNGDGFRDETLSGFGLYNVRQRLQSLFGETAKLTLENNSPRGACATIEIPYA